MVTKQGGTLAVYDARQSHWIKKEGDDVRKGEICCEGVTLHLHGGKVGYDAREGGI
jgi:hypothetical protein